MSVHAFVDESRRGKVYLLTAALVEPHSLAPLRKLMRRLLLPGQRELHFKLEKPERRRVLVTRMVGGGAQFRVYQRTCVASEEAARQDCVARLVGDLLDCRANRLVFDNRAGRNQHDERTIRIALGGQPRKSGLIYEHMDSTQEQLLWLADAAGWCYGAGGHWRRRITPAITDVVDVDQP